MRQNKKPNFLDYLYRNRPKWPGIRVLLSSVISSLKKILVSKDHRFFLIVGFIIGFFTAYTFLPETKSALFWTVLGGVLTLIIECLRKSWEQFKKQTSMGKLLGPIYYKGAKCTVFITEYWRDINKGNLFLYDKETKVKGTSRLMGTGDSTALPYIFGLLMNAGKSYSEISTIKSYIDYQSEWGNNFISVGGLTNIVTESLMTCYKDRLPYYFSDQGNMIIKNYGKYEKYLMGDIEHDYGMIMKIKGLNHPNRVLFIIAGIQDLGTSGSAFYLYNNMTQLASRFGENDFKLIIGVKRKIGEKSAFEVNFDKKSRYLQRQKGGTNDR
jgi:hypothetical protein